MAVGCGYETLGRLTGNDPRAIKRVAREEFNILRPKGLYTSELAALAEHHGWKMVWSNSDTQPEWKTCASFERDRKRFHRKRGTRGRYVIVTDGHFQGLYVGPDGSTSRAGWFRTRAKILAVYKLTEIPKRLKLGWS